MARLQEKYNTEIVPQLMAKFNYKSVMQAPRVQKVVINMGLGEAIQNVKLLESAQKELGDITGQKPVVTKARKSIANFKLREGMPIGCKVTLRSQRMYEFIDRLVNLSLPRIRDFNGVPKKSFDKAGNYSLGIRDQAIFPEIEFDREHRTQGMDIVFVFNHGPQEVTCELLNLLGMPFVK